MKQKSMVKRASRASSGFTLVELLVVITIIIVLAAIGYPTIGKMRASADRSKCISQLRNWGTVMGAYAAEHDGKVEWRNWASIGWDPTKTSVYLDYWTPATVDLPGGQDMGSHKIQLTMRACPAYKFAKGINAPVTYATLRSNPPQSEVSTNTLAKINNPSRFMLMIEATPTTSTYLSSTGEFATRVKPLTQAGPDLRHNGTINALLADFSVRSMTWKEVEKGLAYWNVY